MTRLGIARPGITPTPSTRHTARGVGTSLPGRAIPRREAEPDAMTSDGGEVLDGEGVSSHNVPGHPTKRAVRCGNIEAAGGGTSEEWIRWQKDHTPPESQGKMPGRGRKPKPSRSTIALHGSREESCAIRTSKYYSVQVWGIHNHTSISWGNVGYLPSGSAGWARAGHRVPARGRTASPTPCYQYIVQPSQWPAVEHWPKLR